MLRTVSFATLLWVVASETGWANDFAVCHSAQRDDYWRKYECSPVVDKPDGSSTSEVCRALGYPDGEMFKHLSSAIPWREKNCWN